ncbi:MAG: hypothetical protein V4526_02285 [Patescibacteria group bacterium]
MKDISSLFEKIKRIYDKEVGIIGVVAEAVKKITGITLTANQIKVKEGVVSLSGLSSHAKNQIFIKKEKLLQHFTETVPQLHIVDIR